MSEEEYEENKAKYENNLKSENDPKSEDESHKIND